MSQKKQFYINFLGQLLYTAVNLSINFFLVPKIINNINATAYGFISLSTDFVNYIGLITVALNALSSRFIIINYHKKEYKKANEYFNSTLFANLTIGGVIAIGSVFFITFIDRILNIPVDLVNDVRILFTMVIMNFLTGMTLSVFQVSTNISNKLYLNNIVNIVSQIIRCIILFTAYTYLPMNIWYIGLSQFVCAIIYNTSSYIFCKKLTPEIKISPKFVHIKKCVELTKNGIWSLISTISSMLTNGLDLLITNLLVGSASMGILSIPRSIYSVICTLFESLAITFNPKIIYNVAKENIKDLQYQLVFSYKFLSMFSNTIIATFIILGMNFFELWVPSQDANVLALIAKISVLDLIISMPMQSFNHIYTAFNKIKFPAVVSILFSVATLIVEFIGLSLTKSNIIKLLFISSTSSFFLGLKYLTFTPIYSAKLLNLKKTYFYPIIFRNLIAFIISLSFEYLLFNFISIESWFTFFVACLFVAPVALIITFLINFNKDEKMRVIKLFQSLLKKTKNV